VRMEDGKVQTANLREKRQTPFRLQVPNITRQVENGLCTPGSETFRLCEPLTDEDGEDFLVCRLNIFCDFLGGIPEFNGINRVDTIEGKIQAVGVPIQAVDLGQLELTIYEVSDEAAATGTVLEAEAVRVIFRNPESFTVGTEFMTAEFDVPELSNGEIDIGRGIAIALQLRLVDVGLGRSAVRSVIPSEVLPLDFISFSESNISAAGDGPIEEGELARDSLFGPLQPGGIFGRVGSVVCGLCFPPEAPPEFLRTEWSALTVAAADSLNEGQFPASSARLPGACYGFDVSVEATIGSECGLAGIYRPGGIVDGQVICSCMDIVEM